MKVVNCSLFCCAYNELNTRCNVKYCIVIRLCCMFVYLLSDIFDSDEEEDLTFQKIKSSQVRNRTLTNT
jgi:hypothetical protein